MEPIAKRPGAWGALVQRDRAAHPPALTPAYKTSVARSPRLPPLSFDASVTEATGPVFGPGLLQAGDDDLLTNHAAPGESAIGPRIVVMGRLLDTDGRPIPGALIEIWQANAGGRYRHARDGYLAPLDPNFGGCGRCLTDREGRYAFRTVRPGAYPWPNRANDWRPAHIHLSVFGTAFAQRLVTQLYFEGDPLIALCPIANTLPDAAARDRLVARLDMDATIPMDAQAYRFDIVLRGRRQTPFENRMEGL